jgi:hypothetical protein
MKSRCSSSTEPWPGPSKQSAFERASDREVGFLGAAVVPAGKSQQRAHRAARVDPVEYPGKVVPENGIEIGSIGGLNRSAVADHSAC